MDKILFYYKGQMEDEKDKNIDKGQKDTKKTIKDSKSLYFSSIDKVSSLFNKAQKISTASYILTGHINETDPLRQRIRECSINFLRDIFSINNENSFKNRLDFFILSEKTINELIVLFDIVFLAKLISENNYNVICRELIGTRGDIIKLRSETEKKSFLPESFFSGESQISADNKAFSSESAEINIDKKRNRGRLTYKNESGVIDKNNDSIISKPSLSKEKRKKDILDFVGSNNDVGIKEICNHLTGVGEKTVQRDLTKMVEDGVITRIGNKRWSRYSLV